MFFSEHNVVDEQQISLKAVTSSANLTPVLGCRRRCSAVRSSLLRSSDGRLAGRDWCFRRCPIGGDDHGLASTLTAENDDHASGDDAVAEDDGDSAAVRRSRPAEVADGISGTESMSSYYT